MDTKVNYALVGFFVIVLGAATLIMFFWLSTRHHNKVYNPYLVYAVGSVTGLNAQSPVEYNGVRVGFVDKITLDAHNPQLVKLLLQIEDGTPILESTTATLVPQGITGLVNVGLSSNAQSAPPIKKMAGSMYPVIPFEKPVLTQLTEVLPQLAVNLQEIAKKIQILLNDKNINSANNILTHLDHITLTLDQQGANLNTILKNTADASKNFEATIKSAQRTAITLNESVADVREQLLPSFQEFLNRLNDTASNFQQLSVDLKSNPAILLRGKQPPPLGPGE